MSDEFKLPKQVVLEARFGYKVGDLLEAMDFIKPGLKMRITAVQPGQSIGTVLCDLEEVK